MGGQRHQRAMGIRAGVRWWAGWHPVKTILGFGGLLGFLLANAIVTWWLRWLGTVGGVTDTVRAAIGPILGFLLLGLGVGTAVWLLGTREVNRRYRRGPAAFVDRRDSPVDPGSVLLRADATDGETRPLLDVPRQVSGVVLSVDAETVTVRDATVDVSDRDVRLDGGERSIPAERVSVTLDERTLQIEAGGETYRIERPDGDQRAVRELLARARE